MNARELREKKSKDLAALLTEREQRLRTVRFELAAGRAKNVKEAGLLKKDIARVHTIMCEQS